MVDVATKPKILIKRIEPLGALNNKNVSEEQPSGISPISFEKKKTIKIISSQQKSVIPNSHGNCDGSLISESCIALEGKKEEIVEESQSCPICQEGLQCNDLVKLHCYHSFHYECILGWYQTANKDKNIKQTCPLCREHGGYLPLKFGDKPLKDIHHPNYMKKDPNNKNNYVHQGNLWSNLDNWDNIVANNPQLAYTPNSSGYTKCNAIIKSKYSKKFGKACGNGVVYDVNNPNASHYCKLHSGLYKP